MFSVLFLVSRLLVFTFHLFSTFFSISLLGFMSTSDAFATPAPEASAAAGEGGAVTTSTPAANTGAGG